MGVSSVQAIVAARKDGKFTSLFDFCARLGTGAVNRRGLESLIAAGAFDSLMPDGDTVGHWRACLWAAIDSALGQGQRASEDRLRGQSALFGGGDAQMIVESLPDAAPWSEIEIAGREKAAVGFYLSAHPLDNYRELLARMKIKNIAEHKEFRSGENAKLAGMISGLQVRTSKRGNRFAQFRFEDRSGGVKGVLLGENFNKLSSTLADDGMFIAEGVIEAAEGQDPTLKITELRPLEEARISNARALNLTVLEADERYFESLFHLLERERGRCPVSLTIETAGAKIEVAAEAISVNGSPALQRDLEERGCAVEWVS
jgi:DNA polymerase-3 subunit alpha